MHAPSRSLSLRFAVVVLLPLAVCIAFLGGCHTKKPDQANGLTPVSLQLDWYPQPEHGGFYTAQLLGYYKAEGLDVTLVPVPQYGSVAQQVASGKADFG